jgi:hypothetical protein
VAASAGIIINGAGVNINRMAAASGGSINVANQREISKASKESILRENSRKKRLRKVSSNNGGSAQ